MRRVTLVVGVAVTVAAMMVLTVGSALANDTQPTQVTYTDTVKAEQYFAFPGTAMFRGKAKDIPNDADPGLTGYLDTRITYLGRPDSGVTTPITGGAWMLCSEGFESPPLDNTGTPIAPACITDSKIALQGTVSDGKAEWDTGGGYAIVQTPRGPISVYAGVAKVKADFTVTPGGTVNGEVVTGGFGAFEGTLNHRPLLDGEPPILKGTLKLTF